MTEIADVGGTDCKTQGLSALPTYPVFSSGRTEAAPDDREWSWARGVPRRQTDRWRQNQLALVSSTGKDKTGCCLRSFKRGPSPEDLSTYFSKEVAQSCPTLCDPMDCSPPGSSVRGIFQARVLEWVAISFSRGFSRPRDWTRVSCTAGRCITFWATREAHRRHTDGQKARERCSTSLVIREMQIKGSWGTPPHPCQNGCRQKV